VARRRCRVARSAARARPVQALAGRDHGQPVPVAIVQHERLGEANRLDAGDHSLVDRGEGGGMLDQLVLDAGLVEVLRQAGAR